MVLLQTFSRTLVLTSSGQLSHYHYRVAPPTGHFNHLQSNAHSLSIHCSLIFYGNCHCQNWNKRLIFPPTTHYWSSDNAGGWRSVLCQIHQKSSFNLNSELKFTFLQRVESLYTDSSYTPSWNLSIFRYQDTPVKCVRIRLNNLGREVEGLVNIYKTLYSLCLCSPVTRVILPTDPVAVSVYLLQSGDTKLLTPASCRSSPPLSSLPPFATLHHPLLFRYFYCSPQINACFVLL